MDERERKALIRDLFLYLAAMLALGMAIGWILFVLLPIVAFLVIAGVIAIASLIYTTKVRRRFKAAASRLDGQPQ